MGPDRRAIAAEVFEAGRDYDAAQSDRLNRLRNVEPETAELLGVLVRATRARRVLEVGTSNGHSTLWLADAAEAVGGHVETLDIDPRRTELARANLERAELAAIVECRTVSAAQALAEYPDAGVGLRIPGRRAARVPGLLAQPAARAGPRGDAGDRQRHLPRVRAQELQPPAGRRQAPQHRARPHRGRSHHRGARRLTFSERKRTPRSATISRCPTEPPPPAPRWSRLIGRPGSSPGS